MTLLHSAQKSKLMKTLENYHIYYFHKNTMITKEQNQEEKNSLFEIIHNI